MQGGVSIKIYHEIRQYKDDFQVWHSPYNNVSFLAHWHNEVELIFAREGSAKITIEGTEYTIHKGDLLVCGSHSIHFSDSYNMPNSLEFILFNPDLITANKSAWHKNLYLSAEKMRELNIFDTVTQLFKNVNNELSGRAANYQNIVTAYISAIWYTLMRHFPTESDSTNQSGILKFEKAIAYIHSHFREQISLDDVADSVNLTPTYFSSLFHRFVGISFVHYLQIKRVEEAIRLLQKPGCKVIDAALDSGFTNMRSFNRVFLKITDTTPSTFLKENRSIPLTFSLPYNTGDGSPVENDSFVYIENSIPLPDA